MSTRLNLLLSAGQAKRRRQIPRQITFAIIWLFAITNSSALQLDIYPGLSHGNRVSSVSFSPDGRLALSFDLQTLKIWEVATGREVRTVVPPPRTTIPRFSEDGRSIFAISGDSLTVWDVAMGRITRSNRVPNLRRPLLLSSDGRMVISGGDRSPLKLWDLSRGTELNPLEGRSDLAFSVAFSSDNSLIAAGCSDGVVRLWEVNTGKERRSLVGHQGPVGSVGFSRDGSIVLSGSWDKTLKLWDLSSGREIRTFVGHQSGRTGGGGVGAVALSPDGHQVLSGSTDGLRLWDRTTGAQILALADCSGGVNAVAFSPDGRLGLLGCEDRSVRLLEITNRELRSLGHARPATSAAFSTDGSFVLAASATNSDLWEVRTGRRIRSLIGHTAEVNKVAFIPNSMMALSGAADGTVRLWDTTTGRQMKVSAGGSDGIHALSVSGDGRTALFGRSDCKIEIWDIVSWQQVGSLVVPGPTPSCRPTSLAFFPHTGQAFSASIDGIGRIWNITAQKEVGSFHAAAEPVFSAGLSPDGRLALAGGLQKTARLWEVATNKSAEIFVEGGIRSTAFSSDGHHAVTGDIYEPYNVHVWNVDSRTEVRTLTGHQSQVASVAFSPDGLSIVSAAFDGTARLWDVATGRELLRMVAYDDGEWVAITTEGYYTASPKGDQHLSVRIGEQLYGIDQWRSHYYNPTVVEKTISLRDPKHAIAAILGGNQRQPSLSDTQPILPPVITVTSPKDGSRLVGSAVDIALAVDGRQAPIESLGVSVNGRRVAVFGSRRLAVLSPIPDLKLGQKRLDAKIPIPLDAGENIIEITASNGAAESHRTLKLYTTAAVSPSLPELWFLSIGINKYRDSRIPPLQFAVADAQAITAAFKSLEGRLYGKVHVLELTDESPIKPTRASIVESLRFLRQAGPRDVIMLFIAAHALSDEDGAYNLVPSDAGLAPDGTPLISELVAGSELWNVLQLVSKKILFLDTCFAAGVKSGKTRPADNDRLVRSLTEFGSVVFTSSRGEEPSLEGAAWGHGAFTSAILEGIAGKAYPERDGGISMQGLQAYVFARVRELTGEQQHPVTYTPDGYANFTIAKVR